MFCCLLDNESTRTSGETKDREREDSSCNIAFCLFLESPGHHFFGVERALERFCYWVSGVDNMDNIFIDGKYRERSKGDA